MKTIFSAVLVISVFLISGCSFTKQEFHGMDLNDKSQSIIFGFADGGDEPIETVYFKKYRPADGQYATNMNDGLFYYAGISTNTALQLSMVERDEVFFRFPAQGRNESAVVIKKPGVYFLGSYKYRAIKPDSFFGAYKYVLEKVPSPGEKEALTRLLHTLENNKKLDYSYQISMVKKRLKQL